MSSNIDLLIRTTLKPEDFQAQLFICCCSHAAELTSRVEIERGQQTIALPVIRGGIAKRLWIFDRPNGGELLLSGALIPNTLVVSPIDHIFLHDIRWPGQMLTAE
jgi:hypothetical protein